MTEKLLHTLIQHTELHCKWLNTLSMMENTGARKIKNCEHPLLVNEVILKHAAEEARHAHYLKRQIHKIKKDGCPTYEKKYMLVPKLSYYYLPLLDTQICRYLKQDFGYTGNNLKYAAYLLVTFAIEMRADNLYPLYQTALTAARSAVHVKNIIAEEIHHLQEMREQIKEFSPRGKELCEEATRRENILYEKWILGLKKEVVSYTTKCSV